MESYDNNSQFPTQTRDCCTRADDSNNRSEVFPALGARGEVSSYSGREESHIKGEGTFPKSSYRGVCWNKKNNRWQAAINIQSSYLYLGSYKYEEEVKAAEAFDVAAFLIRGRDKSKLNFPDKIDKILNSKDPNLDSARQKVHTFLTNRQEQAREQQRRDQEENAGGRRENVISEQKIPNHIKRDPLSSHYVKLYSQQPAACHQDQQFLLELCSQAERMDYDEFQVAMKEVNAAYVYQEMPWCLLCCVGTQYRFEKAYRSLYEDEIVMEGILITDLQSNNYGVSFFDPAIGHPGLFSLIVPSVQRACALLLRSLFRMSVLKLKNKKILMEKFRHQYIQHQQQQYFQDTVALSNGNCSTADYLEPRLYQEIKQMQNHQQQMLDIQQQQQQHQLQQDQYLLQQQQGLLHDQLFPSQKKAHPIGLGKVDEFMYARRGFSQSGGLDSQFIEKIATKQRGNMASNMGEMNNFQDLPYYVTQRNSQNQVVDVCSSCPNQTVSLPPGSNTSQVFQEDEEQCQVLDYQDITNEYGFSKAAAQNGSVGQIYTTEGKCVSQQQLQEQQYVHGRVDKMSIGEEILPSMEMPDSQDVIRLQQGASGLPSNIFSSIEVKQSLAYANETQSLENDKAKLTKNEHVENDRNVIDKLSADLKQVLTTTCSQNSAGLDRILTTTRSANMSLELNFDAGNQEYDREMSTDLMRQPTYEELNRILMRQ